ncbi:MAG: DUF3086 domain-containing protein [Pseudanabaenaceae cyanobacterium]
MAEEQSLEAYKEQLAQEIAALEERKQALIARQTADLGLALEKFIKESTKYLEQRKQDLEAEVALLERKKERLEQEMRTTYAGISQEVAVRVQGFKEYLLGTLQDMVTAAETQLHLLPTAPKTELPPTGPTETTVKPPDLSAQTFGEFQEKIEQLLERYRTLPDYYAPPWKLRRTFELTHSERVANWFFNQAGRGSLRSMGTRLQNILVASAIVSILRAVYGERLRVLVLATSPERLGEWRRGFQDCLGLNREHFGPDKGVVLFEDPEPLIVKGDRLVKEGLLPLVIIDDYEEQIAVDFLRFPLLIAYGRDPSSRELRSKPDRSDREDREWSW